jgi:hypothetical protein
MVREEEMRDKQQFRNGADPEGLDSRHVIKPKISCMLRSALIATVLTIVGWALYNFVPTGSAFGKFCGIIGGILIMPGGFFAAFVAMLFSPQGGHGMSDYAWLIVPMTWVIYFVIGALNCRQTSL